MIRVHWLVFGNVQGVGFRYDTYILANQYHLTGWVRNNPDGTVELEIQGEMDRIGALRKELENDIYLEIASIETKRIELVSDESNFQIIG